MFKLFGLVWILALFILITIYSVTIAVASIFSLDSFLLLFLYAIALFLLLFSFADLALHYALKSNKFNFDSDFRMVIDNFSFTHKDKQIQIFTSRISPQLLCVGLFSSTVLIINESVFKSLTPRELRTLVDYELKYSERLASKTEQIVQRFYLISYFPLKRVLSAMLPTMFSSYLLSPFVVFYVLMIKTCRSTFEYEGKNKQVLQQVTFKLKTSEAISKFDLFNCFISFVCRSENKDGELDILKRFDRNEILRW